MQGDQAERATLLGCPVDLVSMETALERIEAIIAGSRPGQVITLNAEILYHAREDQAFQELLRKATLVTPDGIGVVWAARQLGYQPQGRVSGIDLLYQICQRAALRHWSVYLLGAAPGVAEKAARDLADRFPGLRVSGTGHGYFSEDEEQQVVAKVRAASPEILFVALGAPRQEKWIDKHLSRLGAGVCIGVGGSLDVAAGIKNRAPEFFIRFNLEWFYRLLKEPSRIKRQIVLPRFVLLVLKEKYFPRFTR
jgi:N-acetylglucosaminyldiphosphoundecaprenol N-acetyl-beta-D-mannosaminyltransferase